MQLSRAKTRLGLRTNARAHSSPTGFPMSTSNATTSTFFMPSPPPPPPPLPRVPSLIAANNHGGDIEGWCLVRSQRHRLAPVLTPRVRLWLSLGVGTLHLSRAPTELPLHTLPLYQLNVTTRRSHIALRCPGTRMHIEPEDMSLLSLWGDTLERITGRVFDDHYRLGNELARGSFATVYKATRKSTGENVAVKLISTSAKRAQTAAQLAAETRAMAQFGDVQGLMGAKEVFHEKGLVYIVMEFYKGGSLKELVCDHAPYGAAERIARNVALKLCRALAIMHGHGVAHRDVKLENCLCRDNSFPPDDVVLADFGFAIYMRETPPSKRSYAVGTPVYVSPEAARSEPHGTEVDMYALGVLVYRMMASEYPVEGRDDRETLRIMAGGQVKVNYNKTSLRDVSPACIRFLKATLQWDPRKRISARAALVHPWLIVALEEEYAVSGVLRRVGLLGSVTPKRRWKMAIYGVVAMRWLREGLEGLNAPGRRDYGSWTGMNERLKRVSLGKENALAAISSVSKMTSSRIESVIKLRTANGGSMKG